MTRKLAGFGLAFALAELAAAYLPPLASLLTAALFISLFLFAAFTQRRAARFALPAVAGLLAGLVWSAAYQLAVVKPAQSLAGQTYACTAIVQPDAETSWQPGNVRATLLITRLDGRKTSLKVYCTDLPYSEAGDIITGQFQLQPLQADSYRMSRYAKGTWLGASYQADYIWQGTSDALPYRLYHLRQAFAKRLTTYLPQNLAGVEAAMLLGEKSELTDEWSDTFRTAGIAHLLAVSGLHVALLCGLFAMGQGRRSRFSVPRILLQITVLLLYMGLTGLPFSVFRAGVMFLIMLVGSLLLQPPDSLTALALAAIIIGVQQPYAPCDIGLQLSVCGVLGVLAASALAKRQTQFVQARYAAAITKGGKPPCRCPLPSCSARWMRCRLRYWPLWQPCRSCCCMAWQPAVPQCPPTCWWCGCLARRCGWGFWHWCFPLCRCWTRCSTGQACCLALYCA